MLLSLQACRFLAALLVVLFHTAGVVALDKYFGVQVFEKCFRFGGSVGVEFFFVLSGFIITQAHHRDFNRPDQWRRYALRRVFRIYPTYWLVLAVLTAALVLTQGLDSPALPQGAVGWIKTITLWPQDPAVVGGTGSPVVAVAWSLQYEMLFYTVVGLCIVGTRWLVAAAIGVAASGVLCAALGVPWPLSFIQVPLLLLFLFGAVASVVVQHVPLARPSRWAVALGLAWCGFVAFGIGVGWEVWPAADVTASTLLHGTLCAGLIVALVQAERRGELRLPPWADAAGGLSYALYLIHFPLVSATCKLLVVAGVSGLAGATLAMLAVPVVSTVGAWLVWRGVERPVQQALHRRFLSSRRAPLVAA